MKTINIYLNADELKKCSLLQNKYRVSLSTLADKVIFYTYRSLIRYANDNWKKIFEGYLSKGKKTSIKPRAVIKTDWETAEIPEYNVIRDTFCKDNNLNMFATNCLKIYLAKDIKNYIKPEGINQYYCDIDRELTKAVDPNWDYNERLRKTARMVKQNKEYFQRLINES